MNEHRKACACRGTSTKGRIRTRLTHVGGLGKIEYVFYPQPSCDRCGTPWHPNTPGAVSVLKADKATEETGDDRPAAPFQSQGEHP